MSGEIGVISPTQTPKRYSRRRIQFLPSSSEARHSSCAHAHESPETVLIPVGAGMLQVGVEPHQQSHCLVSQEPFPTQSNTAGLNGKGF